MNKSAWDAHVAEHGEEPTGKDRMRIETSEKPGALKRRIINDLHIADAWDGEYAHREFSPHGWFCRTNQKMLDLLCRQVRPSIVIEIGSWMGRSTRFLAERCDLVIAIDHWRGSAEHQVPHGEKLPMLFDQFLSNCEPLRDKILPLRMASADAAQMPLPKADLIFIDGDHSEAAVAADIQHYYGFLSDTGVMCGDDYDLRVPRGHGVARATATFAESHGLRVGVTAPFWWYVPTGDRGCKDD